LNVFVCLFYFIFYLENVVPSPNKCEELFDILAHLLSPKYEDASLNTFFVISAPFKLEADSQESGTLFLENEGTSLF